MMGEISFLPSLNYTKCVKGVNGLKAKVSKASVKHIAKIQSSYLTLVKTISKKCSSIIN